MTLASFLFCMILLCSRFLKCTDYRCRTGNTLYFAPPSAEVSVIYLADSGNEGCGLNPADGLAVMSNANQSKTDFFHLYPPDETK